MTTLEQELKDGLSALAQAAPDDLGLLARVQAGAARRTRRRRLGAVVVATAVAAAAVVGATVRPGGRDSSLQYAHDPGTFFTASSAVASFPYTAGSLPPRFERVPASALVTPAESSLTWQAGSGVQGNLQVALSSRRPDPDPQRLATGPQPVREAVQVRGVQGTLSCDAVPSCRLTWQEASGRWLRVDRTGDVAATVRAETLAVAQGLRTQAYRPPTRLRVDLVPRGCTFAELAPDHLDLAGPAATCDLSIALVASLGYPGTRTTYAGRPAVEGLPADHPTQRQVFVTYPGGEDVSLLVPRAWERNLVDALVAGITVRPATR